MPHFLLKLIPPRPTFAQDITADERTQMQAHAAYVGKLFHAGNVLAYGPVMDAAGAYGIAIMEASDEAEVMAIMAEDPTVRSGLNTCTLAPMHLAASQASQSAGSAG